MNSNNPSNPFALYSLLNRDQYGDKPLLYRKVDSFGIRYLSCNRKFA